MKRTSLYTGRFALTGVAAAALWLTAVPDAWALGLGRLDVQSTLGESLRAEIDVTSLTPEEAANLRIRIAPPESYRAAGVDYNAVLPGTQAQLMRRADGRPYLRLTSDRSVQEPFVDVILEISWNTGQLVREYTLLFDPPTRAQAAAPAPAPATAPVFSQAPQSVAVPEPAPQPAAAPIAAAPAEAAPANVSSEPLPEPKAPSPSPRTAERKRGTPRSAAAPSAAVPGVATAPAPVPAAGAEEYRVRSGDTLSRIAGRMQQPGVSLDQMLVSLFRANGHAFAGGNMNRLKSGAVLSVPSAESAGAITAQEAREVIQAQSADFGAYRQRLAAGVPDAKTEGSARQAAGKVEATVQDRKQAAATTPDKLTLSKGGASSKAAVPEEKVSKQREKRDAETRAAEMAKNVEELKRLASAASVPSSKAPAAAPAPATTVATVTAPIAPPAPPVLAPAPTEPPASAATSGALPAVVAQSTAPVASAPDADAANAAASAVVAKPPVKAPVVARPSATPVEEPSALGTMFDDNPWALGLAAALVAMLAGFGVYRFSRRAKKDNGETSFLESRLQPDSFFGASGGQRIDTRDAGAASSSMSYSLSQLDAIGDVDPVAEADVYLAYGRDLQAEEILKEAMRSNPDRLAIRTKLLEVYAKRRDTKGFELLATQLFSLTQGEGEDWAKAQELGEQIDPENPLYKPGGAPPAQKREGPAGKEPLGATTMPQSVLPTPAQYERSNAAIEQRHHQEAVDSRSLDLDLDLGADPPAAPVNVPSRDAGQQPAPREVPRQSPSELNFGAVPGIPPAPAPAASGPSSDFAMDFDLSAISLDLDGPGNGQVGSPSLSREPEADLSGIDLGSDDDGGDPLARKLELAEEFRQIGDMEGARDLLQEVVVKANGALKSKAQGMLDGLS